MADNPQIERINALTANARTTWFALLGALIFVGITLMGVEHIDFYGVDRATRLPLVNVDVPTRLFFVGAPLLVAAIYSYFQLYLIRLWDALGAADAKFGSDRLGDLVAPWLITDGALHYRRRARKDDCTPPRAMDWPSAFWNLLLGWAFGPIVLFFCWWQSWPARDWQLSAVSAFALGLALCFGAASIIMLRRRMRAPENPSHDVITSGPALSGMLVMLIALPALTFERTSGHAGLAPLDLSGQQITLRPDGWLTPFTAREEAKAKWCNRYGHTCSDLSEDLEERFATEWQDRRKGQVAELRTNPALNPLRPDDLQAEVEATLGLGLFFGIDLSTPENRTRFARAVADHTTRAPNLLRGDLRGAFLVGANLTGARMMGAKAQGANFERARMSFANLSSDGNQRTILTRAIFTSADLRWAQLQRANLRGAQLQGAHLGRAQLQGADFGGAQLQGAELWEAQLQGADLRRALLTGTSTKPMLLQSTNLSASTNDGGALRFVDLSGAIFDARTDFRNVFLDGSVTLPPELEQQMDDLCQRHPDILPDAAFFGHWRGWLEKEYPGIWPYIAPAEYRDIPAIPPPADCHWKSGSMPQRD